jgi:hypothetical protein
MTAAATTGVEKKQIPIVCPGHTRPLAELQFCQPGMYVCWSIGKGSLECDCSIVLSYFFGSNRLFILA